MLKKLFNFRNYLSGLWLPVCKEKFGEKEAIVACRQMGFAGVAEGYPKVLKVPKNSPLILTVSCYENIFLQKNQN